jgi:hypothetical protein
VKWALPFLAGFEWWIVNELRSPEFALWSQVGPAFLYSVLVVGPVAAAFAGLRAWAERRPSLGDLMVTSARDPMTRQWVAAFGDVSWVAVAYLVTLGVVVAAVAPQASWGGPDVGMLTAGFLAVWACGLIGWLAGWLLPSRITGPIVGVSLDVLMGLALTFDVKWGVLSPSGAPESLRPYEQIRPGVGWWQALWFTGLAASALAVTALLARSRRSRWLLGFGGSLAVVAAIALAPGVGRSQVDDSPLVCDPGEIEVCYHPAYESGMPEVKVAVIKTVLPLVEAGLFPPRAVMQPSSSALVENPEWIPFSPSGNPGQVAVALANWVFSTGGCNDITEESAWRTQFAVVNWLVIQAGYNPGAGVTITDQNGTRPATLEDVVDPETMDLIEKFSDLSHDQQVSWLAANFDPLLQCKTDFGSLP